MIQVSAHWPAPLPHLPPEEPVLGFLARFTELEERGGRAGFDGGVTILATLSSLGHPRRGLVGSGRCRMSRRRLEATAYVRMDHIVQET